MFNIEVTTHSGERKNYAVISAQLAGLYFSAMTQALDAASVIMIDGLTGEVLNAWENGKMTIFCGASLE